MMLQQYYGAPLSYLAIVTVIGLMEIFVGHSWFVCSYRYAIERHTLRIDIEHALTDHNKEFHYKEVH